MITLHKKSETTEHYGTYIKHFQETVFLSPYLVRTLPSTPEYFSKNIPITSHATHICADECNLPTSSP